MMNGRRRAVTIGRRDRKTRRELVEMRRESRRIEAALLAIIATPDNSLLQVAQIEKARKAVED
jgi:hypothetical protein